ncbi:MULTISPECIES: helix-turn-helix transcriptional regulator [unclassified Pseudomonas]|uniref:helix-turn-helix domain-containing protein n=1 Tax=unclassified Pseudomonas TaxID=196821 RepID=UPI000A0AAD3F|nr:MULTISPECIES: helix-turn-helix transcriptional regulator [unclassified Pseudomonas]SMF23408.1 Transcriptional regulator, contains XRE-family HTH domain [Pseudomonas sp. LAIL14HWK12:I11]SMR74296.1 Transcriptional regulator, contains XRE-family HTH domain [Pseudomonas sp. LAIL14HWK12:I10]SOD03533.1 Transcriptional regulator, contains XRE-family HTH domain [Pseudomonas sp. LAIL14HWK12:I8]
MAIGDRLKEERSRLGVSQTDLATAGGVGKTTQINYEKGERSPDASYLSAVAEKGVDVLYVVTGERKPQSSGSLAADEALLVERYRSMTPEAKATVNSVSEALAVFHK